MKHPKSRADRRKNEYNKFLNRLKRSNIDINDIPSWAYTYKNHDTICSCSVCDPHKAWKSKDKFSIRRKMSDLDEE